MRAGLLGEHGLPDRHEHAAADALEDAEGDRGCPTDQATPHSTEPTMNRVSEIDPHPSWPPNRWTAQPVIGMRHGQGERVGGEHPLDGGSEVSKSRPSVLTATLTIVVSRIVMIAPSDDHQSQPPQLGIEARWRASSVVAMAESSRSYAVSESVHRSACPYSVRDNRTSYSVAHTYARRIGRRGRGRRGARSGVGLARPPAPRRSPVRPSSPPHRDRRRRGDRAPCRSGGSPRNSVPAR